MKIETNTTYLQSKEEHKLSKISRTMQSNEPKAWNG